MIIGEKTDRAIRKYVADTNAKLAEDCLVVGEVYRHPKSKRLLRVISGQFFGGYGWTAKPIEE